MRAVEVPLTAHCIALYLLQMVALSSEQFTVSGLQGPVLAPLGGILELSCQLSPPQQAKHMEIRWFQNRYTEPVFLYRNGKDLIGETIYKFVERTELLKDDIGKGKVTLRIFKVTADDGGYYHCFFKDDKFYEEHITEVKVTATSSEIQIVMHPPDHKGVMMECHSGWWFPKPKMEWRGSTGEIIPDSPESHSQDENKSYNMTMTLVIKAYSHSNVTCYLQNPVTHHEESISIVIPGELFPVKRVWIMFTLLIFIHMTYNFEECLIHVKERMLEPSGQAPLQISTVNSELKQMLEGNEISVQISTVNKDSEEVPERSHQPSYQISTTLEDREQMLEPSHQISLQISTVNSELNQMLEASGEISIQISTVNSDPEQFPEQIPQPSNEISTLLQALEEKLGPSDEPFVQNSTVNSDQEKTLESSDESSLQNFIINSAIEENLRPSDEPFVQISTVNSGTNSKKKPSLKTSILDFIISVAAITGSMLILHLKQRDAGHHTELNTLWLEDISVILCVLIVFNRRLKSLILFRLYGYSPSGQTCKHKLYNILRFSQPLFFTISSAIILLMYLRLQNKVSFPDPLFTLYSNWMVAMQMVLVFLLAIEAIALWLYKRCSSNCT